MAELSVTQLLSLINQEVESREALNGYLSKAKALAHVALKGGLSECPFGITHDYLWVLSDLIEKMDQANEQSLNLLLRFELKEQSLN